MSRRFFTADFHLYSSLLVEKGLRPFKSSFKMTEAYIRSCNQRAKVYYKTVPVVDENGNQLYRYECELGPDGKPLYDKDTGQLIVDKVPMVNRKVIDRDVIIHIGDFCCWKGDRGFKGSDINPQEIVQSRIYADFINIRGNHDDRNRVKSACDSMRTTLGRRFTSVSISHYPSDDPRAKGMFRNGDVHLCGHVHGLWKYKIDKEHSVLNVNMGVDVWNHNIVSEDELITDLNEYIRKNFGKENLLG